MFVGTGYLRGGPPNDGTLHVGAYFDPTCDPSGYGEAAVGVLPAHVLRSADERDGHGWRWQRVGSGDVRGRLDHLGACWDGIR